MKWKVSILAAAMAAATSTSASEWTGTESDDWFDPANWTAGVPTASTDQVRINTTNPYSAQIDGGSAATGTLFRVGHNGIGELTLLNGATLISGSAGLGNQLAGNGSVLINGTGSTWEVLSGNFDIGSSGTGLLEILDGGLLQTPGLTSRLGQAASGSGNVVISGAGSAWEHQGHFWLGTLGSGQMTVSDGGFLGFSGTSTLGQNNNADGVMLVTGPGSLVSGTRLHVGNGATSVGTLATGLVQVSDGGTLELTGSGPPANYRLIIASNASSEGTVIVGAPSGEPPLAPGVLLLTGGIGFNNGVGTLLFNHTGSLDMDFAVIGPINGSGHIQAENGTTVFSGEPFDFQGSLTISENAIFGAAGKLGDVDNEGRLVASPGQSATLEIQGDYSHGENAMLEIQLSPGPAIDLVNISGEANLQGGGVHITVLPGDYGNIPLDGVYPILTAAGGRIGEFDPVVSGNPNAFTLAYDGDTVLLEVSDELFKDRYQDE
jgi:T5SS/PEP-CTERM-associated repeat protein